MCFANIEPVQKHEDICNALMDIKNSIPHGSENGTHTRGFNFSDQIVTRNAEHIYEFVGEKSLQNGQTEFEAKEFNGHADFSIKNQSQNLMQTCVDNGSSSYVFSAEKTETMTLKTEIEEENVVRIEHKSKLQVTEFDVERVLEEQETHDLFCPNCRSCITKRVILRKRKRTVQESKYDFKHQKVPDTKNDRDVTAVLTENTNEDNETKREVFGCFECFRFFTMKGDGGFDICGIFRRRRPQGDMPMLVEAPIREWSSPSLIDETGETNDMPMLVEAPSLIGAKIDESKEIMADMPMLVEAPTGVWGWASLIGAKVFKSKENMTDEGAFEEQRNYPTEGESEPSLITIPESEVHGEQITPGKKVDDRNDNKTSGKALPEEGKYDSGKGRLDTLLIAIPGSEVHGEQIIIEEKVSDPNRSKSKGKELSEGPNENLGKNLPDEHLICMPQFVVHAEFSGGGFITSTGEGIEKPIEPIIDVSVPPTHDVIASSSTEENKDPVTKERTRNEWDILKSIVYGGLIESITSLGVVSSAAGSDASTLNIVALGLANLIGGFFVIIHNLLDLRNERQETRGEEELEQAGRYWELLGRQKNFRRHVTVAVISYLIFGLLPPVIYGFSFRKSDSREYKLITIAAASLLCIALLAISKAHVRLEKDYFKCLTYYLGLGLTASGLSYVAGVLIHQFLNELGLFDPQTDVPTPPFDGFILNGPKSPFSSSY